MTTLHQINGTTGADTLSGNSTKPAQIDGLTGNDTITAGGAGDTIIGGAGNDVMTGGAGMDTFVFHAGFGIDRINSFAATRTSHDIIQVDKTLSQTGRISSARPPRSAPITKSPTTRETRSLSKMSRSGISLLPTRSSSNLCAVSCARQPRSHRCRERQPSTPSALGGKQTWSLNLAY
jgi:hypothetical protein